MPYRPGSRQSRPAMYNTPAIRNGGFGALQVEAVTNRPLSIARRHLAASQLRMREIEPDELSSSEWVRFLVMEEQERDRWMSQFLNRRRRGSDESSSSNDSSSRDDLPKAEEARSESIRQTHGLSHSAETSSTAPLPSPPHNSTPSVSLWARQYQDSEIVHSSSPPNSRAHPASLWARQFAEGEDQVSNEGSSRPSISRRVLTNAPLEAPPTYENAVRARTPPPAYVSRNEYARSPRSP